MTDQTPISQAVREPRLYGVVDVLRSDRVAGWVIDRTDPGRCAIVEVRREGRLAGTAAANRPRKDLERQAVGTGAYGFAFAFDPPLEEGMEFTVAVTARTHDGVELTLQPAAGAAKAAPAEKRALGRILAELAHLRTDIGALRQDLALAEERRADAHERMERVQLRLERGISATDAPQARSSWWLAGVAVTGAAIAVGSVAVGLFSL
ncbi:hypothetical protein EYF88_07405 [Paracoccus sediminis]|uniref:Uncharacterized protein n=1 Tax=Paracoccus sediminis TaxID=1214787 RepID=A0A238W8D2_9RHOB|nr:hypothetical protein [Paracoccus sediminis]TBN51603.1 hypothetical protein EYF88_07405 [Paracoccus sediminis]SNR41939.1 hypothetical protein SAMN06265378_103392 [Paracoccus sediminis]